MAFAGRKLSVSLRNLIDTTLFEEDSSTEDKFDLLVGLKGPEIKDVDPVTLKEMNSSTSISIKGSVVIGMIIAFANAIW